MRNTASAESPVLADTALAATALARTDQAAVPGVASSEGSGWLLIMTFDTLTPASGSDATPAGAVRGMAGGRLPWILGAGSGSLSRDGHLQVRIRGLVLAGHAPVPATLRGTNPFPAFRVVVSWLSAGAGDTAAFASASTGDFEASPSGDCDIDARVSIPEPCLAPVVLVTGPSGTGSWLAVTGR